MFNLFNKQPINYKEYTADELFNQLINDINDIKLTNNNLKDENTKLKNTINDIQLNIQLDNKQKNNFIIKYNNDINNLKDENIQLKNIINNFQLDNQNNKIQLDNRFNKIKIILNKKFNEFVELNKLMSLTHTYLCQLRNFHHNPIENIENRLGNNRLCMNLYLYYVFIQLFKNYKNIILSNELYNLIINFIKSIDESILDYWWGTKNNFNIHCLVPVIEPNSNETIHIHTSKLLYKKYIIPDPAIEDFYDYYMNLEFVNNGTKYNKIYLIKLLTVLNKIIVPYVNSRVYIDNIDINLINYNELI